MLQAREACGDGSDAILVLPGDMPLLSETTLERLVEHHRETGAAATLLTASVDDPTGYGRVLREGGLPVAIVEHRDATPEQRAIREIDTSVYCFDGRALAGAGAGHARERPGRVLPHRRDRDPPARAGSRLEAVIAEDAREGLGVNDRKQLAALAAVQRRRILDRLMADGVTVLDPASTYVDDTVTDRRRHRPLSRRHARGAHR